VLVAVLPAVSVTTTIQSGMLRWLSAGMADVDDPDFFSFDAVMPRVRSSSSKASFFRSQGDVSHMFLPDCQLRLILSSFIEPHFVHVTVRSSNFPPNKMGLIRITTISSPHSRHIREASRSGVRS
jgi:hypothetical protein